MAPGAEAAGILVVLALARVFLDERVRGPLPDVHALGAANGDDVVPYRVAVRLRPARPL